VRLLLQHHAACIIVLFIKRWKERNEMKRAFSYTAIAEKLKGLGNNGTKTVFQKN
jgi:hypothetical protein